MTTTGHTGWIPDRIVVFPYGSSCLSRNRYTGKTINAINLGSYNYLGFAEKTGPCATDAINALKTFGVGICNTRTELGTFRLFIDRMRARRNSGAGLALLFSFCSPYDFAFNRPLLIVLVSTINHTPFFFYYVRRLAEIGMSKRVCVITKVHRDQG